MRNNIRFYLGKVIVLIFWLTILSTNVYTQSEDSIDINNHYKSLNVSVGIGSIEFLNINFSKNINSGFYINFSVGGTFVQDEGIAPIGGKFLKGGISWKILNNDITPIISVDAGKVFLDVGESFPPYFMVSDNAFLISMLAGVETQFKSGFFFLIRVGERFSRREFEKDQYITGLQISFGWSF